MTSEERANYNKKALDVLEVMNFSTEEREAYEGRLKWFRIEANTIEKYEKIAEEKGMERGMEKGIERGIETTAINMLKQKLNDSLIKQVTGFSQEKIDRLKNKL